MIITTKKHQNEILKLVENCRSIFIVGCGSCAAKCGTGDEKAVAELKRFFEENGKTVEGSFVLDSACDMRLVKRDLLKNESFKKSDTAVILSCGAGVQSVESAGSKKTVPALDSKYVGSTERIGVYKQFCSICGTCILSETESVCPRTRCAKGLVNGPCGGFVKGKCETDQSKDCAWVLIFEKLKNNGKLESFVNNYIKPKNSF